MRSSHNKSIGAIPENILMANDNNGDVAQAINRDKLLEGLYTQ
jgi:hypothetical protein